MDPFPTVPHICCCGRSNVGKKYNRRNSKRPLFESPVDVAKTDATRKGDPPRKALHLVAMSRLFEGICSKKVISVVKIYIL